MVVEPDADAEAAEAEDADDADDADDAADEADGPVEADAEAELLDGQSGVVSTSTFCRLHRLVAKAIVATWPLSLLSVQTKERPHTLNVSWRASREDTA